jgi:transportin-1
MTVMAWQPDEEPLRQLSSCLKDSLSGHDKNTQKQAEIVSGMPNIIGRSVR